MLKYNYGICGVTRLLGAFLILCQPVLAQKTWYVATDGDDANFGTNGWDDAYLTISNAVSKSATLDTILVGPGEYLLTTAITIPADKNIHLLGVAGPSNTIINGNSPVYEIRGLNVNAGRVGGFTITNAFYNPSSIADIGGVSLAANTIMTNCIITGNRAGRYSGGVGVSGGVLSNCVIRGNQAAYVGGVTVTAGGQILNCLIENNISTNHVGGCRVTLGSVVSNCVISGNTAGASDGGCENVSGFVTDCVISGNMAGTTGGGATVAENCILRNSIICDNVSSSVLNYAGGGVYMRHTNSLLLNCLIYGNQAPNGGGGGVGMVHDADIDACTIVGNSAGVAGGGVYTHWAAFSGMRMVIRNSIVYSNTAPTGSNWAGLSIQYTWFTNSCITNLIMPQGSGLITGYPEFVDSVNHNYQLQAGSPCINAGLNQPWMSDAVDMDGHTRIDRYSGRVDIGCYEYLLPGTLFQVR